MSLSAQGKRCWVSPDAQSPGINGSEKNHSACPPENKKAASFLMKKYGDHQLPPELGGLLLAMKDPQEVTTPALRDRKQHMSPVGEAKSATVPRPKCKTPSHSKLGSKFKDDVRF